MTNPSTRDRYLELLADDQLGQLAVEDAAELARLRAQLGDLGADPLGELLVAADRAAGTGEMPADMAERIASRGRAYVAGEPAGRIGGSSGRAWLAIAVAAGLVAAVSIAFTVITINERERAEAAWQTEVAMLQERLQSNETLLASARQRAEQLRTDLAEATGLTEQQRTEIARAAEREVELAQRLADATAGMAATRAQLDEAQLRIARLEAPIDPTELAANRQKLLEVPGTVRLAWSDFDLPDAPAELAGVQGDVVWNDELEQGYLRFVGLPVNDPDIEQYQIWVIDERGMEQKVSGGVFNANAEGEIIVPIEPHIDVGRVALFAVTIEDPGGIVVPDLSRRVVVAPRGEG